jgi:hypothetical protein
MKKGQQGWWGYMTVEANMAVGQRLIFIPSARYWGGDDNQNARNSDMTSSPTYQ